MPEPSSLVLLSLGPKTSDPPVGGAGPKVVRGVCRRPFEGSLNGADVFVFEDGKWWIEWEVERYAPTTYEGAVLYGPDEEWCRSAVSRARQTWCPSTRRYLASVTTGRTFAVPCLAWSCPGCNKRKWFASRELFRRGIEAAWERGEPVRMLTLTAPRRTMTVPELGAAWDDLAQLLRRGGPAPVRPVKPKNLKSAAAKEKWKERYEQWVEACKERVSLLDEYASVVEFGGKHGRIHLHVFATGRFVAQKQLSKWAMQSGFGKIAHIVEVKQETAKQVGSYAGKMASYAAKANDPAVLMKQHGATRVRPVRSSAGWLTGGLRGVEEQLGIRPKARRAGEPPRSGGPWALIELNADGEPRWRRTIGDTDQLPRAHVAA